MTKIIAHRGSSSTHPENTMVAFQAAEQVGADGIELDVHVTKDGELVVIHDHTLNRTTNGKGLVKDYTLCELRTLDAGGWFLEEFKDQKIPTLREVLIWLQTNMLSLNIELKNIMVDYPYIEERVVHMIHEFDMKERTVISSFQHDSISNIKNIDPQIECAILFMEPIDRIWEYANKLGAEGVHPYVEIVDEKLLMQVAVHPLKIRVFTVNEKEKINQYLRGNCEAIFTDYPARAIYIRNKIIQHENN